MDSSTKVDVTKWPILAAALSTLNRPMLLAGPALRWSGAKSCTHRLRQQLTAVSAQRRVPSVKDTAVVPGAQLAAFGERRKASYVASSSSVAAASGIT